LLRKQQKNSGGYFFLLHPVHSFIVIIVIHDHRRQIWAVSVNCTKSHTLLKANISFLLVNKHARPIRNSV